MILLDIFIILKYGFDTGPVPWIWYIIPLILRFCLFVVSFLIIYFFFEKASKRYEHRAYWNKIMKMMFFVGLLFNFIFVMVNIVKQIINVKEMKSKYASKGP